MLNTFYYDVKKIVFKGIHVPESVYRAYYGNTMVRNGKRIYRAYYGKKW